MQRINLNGYNTLRVFSRSGNRKLTWNYALGHVAVSLDNIVG